MSPSRTPFIFLTVASVLCALAWLGLGWAQASRSQAQTALRGLEQTRAELAQTQAQLARWEALGLQRVVGRVEPVALEAGFTPAELARSAVLLAGLYADHGYFNLHRFSLAWAADGAQTDMVRMTLQGEKVFVSPPQPTPSANPVPAATRTSAVAPAAPSGAQ